MNRRSDRYNALLINAAIHAAASHGVVGAAKELLNLGIPWHVVMRVLSRPGERRTYSRTGLAELSSN